MARKADVAVSHRNLGGKKMSRAERLCLLYDEAARLLQEHMDPVARPGHIRTRPFSGSRAREVDRLWEEIEAEPAGSAEMLACYKDLVQIYQIYGGLGARMCRIPTRVGEEVSALMKQIEELEAQGVA